MKQDAKTEKLYRIARMLACARCLGLDAMAFKADFKGAFELTEAMRNSNPKKYKDRQKFGVTIDSIVQYCNQIFNCLEGSGLDKKTIEQLKDSAADNALITQAMFDAFSGAPEQLKQDVVLKIEEFVDEWMIKNQGGQNV